MATGENMGTIIIIGIRRNVVNICVDMYCHQQVTAVGFEPTHPKIVELESTALDHSAKVSIQLSGAQARTM